MGIQISVLVFATCVLTENQDYGRYPDSFFKHEEQAPFVRAMTEKQDDDEYLGNTDNYEERSLTENQGQIKEEKEDFAVDSENRRGPKRRRTSQAKRRPSYQSKGRPSYEPSTPPKGRPSYQSKGRPSYEPSYQSKGRPSYHPKGRPSYEPSTQPKGRPSYQSKGRPSYEPSTQPKRRPSYQSKGRPSYEPMYSAL